MEWQRHNGWVVASLVVLKRTRCFKSRMWHKEKKLELPSRVVNWVWSEL